jgi:type IV pilus assembly protein PilW
MISKGKRSSSRQAGFTMIELLVGLAIGLLLTGVIIQVMSAFEVKTRTTTGAADAQTNGGIALYSIGRELQLAGYPLLPVTNSPLECTTVTYGSTGITSISPVSITNGVVASGVSASDTVVIRYGSSLMGGVPTQITAVGPPTSVVSNFGCQAGDISLVTDGATCALSTVTAVTGTAVNAMSVTLADTAATAVSANLACMGSWNQITYAVSNGNLVRNGVPTLTGIVNLQAQYGVSATANSNQVTQWVDASGGTWAAPTVADRNRIKAIRLAVVARNEKKELSAVTAACSSTTIAAPTGLCAWEGTTASPAPTIDLSDNDPDWLRYRYRVFETIIPLRNVIWSKDTL